MNLSRFSPKILIGILLAIFFFVAFSFRVFLPYDQIFRGEWVAFTSVDAYFQMRLVDNLVHNFPTLMNFDPYFIFPGGGGIGNIHFFNWFLAGIIWVVGLGSPTQHTVDVIGVYFPVILAALTVIPVYFIGQALFNRWAGVIAAALVAVLPGEFLGRSILGFTDQHIAETLFSTTAVLFLILAIKTARQRGLTLDHLRCRDWGVSTRPLVYALLAGIFMGVYLITWAGALLFVFIIVLYLIVQSVINHLRRQSNDYLGIIGIILFFIALIIYIPFTLSAYFVVSLVIALLMVVVLSGVSRLVEVRGIRPGYYPLSLLGLGIVGLAIFYAVNPSLVEIMLSQFGIFAPVGATATTTLEMQPFLSPQGSFSTAVAWGNFTTSFFLLPPSWGPDNIWFPPGFALISLIILIWLSIKRRGDDEQWLLFLVWTLIILVATLVQRRFAYYLVVNVALLSAYLSWQAIWFSGLRKVVAKPEGISEKEPYHLEAPKGRNYYQILGITRSASHKEIKKAFRRLASEYDSEQNRTPEAEEKFKEINKAYEVLSNPQRRVAYDQSISDRSERTTKRRREVSQGLLMHYINTVLAIIVVFFFIFFPNIVQARDVASEARFAPSKAWQEALLWMKGNTPEPFGDPDAYYKLYEPPPKGEDFEYPESAYGVTGWWDYGYWITRIANRVPSTNPSQEPGPITKVVNLFLSQEESLTYDTMAELESSYLIIDYATCTSKFWALVTWAGREQAEFIGVYHVPHEGKLLPVKLFYPEYYRAMCVRLFNFDGKAVTTESPMVVTYDEKVDREGNRYRQVSNIQGFSSYQEALHYVESEGASNHSIVGINPLISPVPLEPLQNYKLVYSSEAGVPQQDNGIIPEVKVFEYVGPE